MNGKKGFLFTFITILLLFSLVVLTYSYLERNKQSQEFIAGLAQSSRLNFIKEDVVSNYYMMMDIELLDIYRDNNTIILRFENFSIFSEEGNYSEYLASLEEYVENQYSNMSNVGIDLENFVPEFRFYPYNTSFVIDANEKPEELFIYMNDSARFQELTLDIYLNVSDSTLNYTEVPDEDDTEDPLVWVRVFDVDENLMMNESLHLSSTKQNDNFLLSFDKVIDTRTVGMKTIYTYQNLEFFYGKYNDVNVFGQDRITDATFHLKAAGLEAGIERLYLNYTLSDKKAILMTEGEMYLR